MKEPTAVVLFSTRVKRVKRVGRTLQSTPALLLWKKLGEGRQGKLRAAREKNSGNMRRKSWLEDAGHSFVPHNPRRPLTWATWQRRVLPCGSSIPVHCQLNLHPFSLTPRKKSSLSSMLQISAHIHVQPDTVSSSLFSCFFKGKWRLLMQATGLYPALNNHSVVRLRTMF